MSPETFSHDVAGWLAALTALVAPLLTFIGAVYGILAYLKSHNNELRLNGQSDKIDNLQTSSIPATMFLTPTPPAVVPVAVAAPVPPVVPPPVVDVPPPVVDVPPPVVPPVVPPIVADTPPPAPLRIDPMPDDRNQKAAVANFTLPFAAAPPSIMPGPPMDMMQVEVASNRANIVRAAQALVMPPPPDTPNAG